MGLFDGALNAFGAALGQAGAGFGALLGSSGGGFTSGVSKGPGFGVGQSPGSSFRVGGLGGPGFGVGQANGGGFGVRGFAGNGFNTGNPLRFAKPAQPAGSNQPAFPGQATTASGGAYGSHERWRSLIEQFATNEKIDPDAFAAMLQIETNGDPQATSGAGARGLGQIMPATWDGLVRQGAVGANDNPYDPQASLKASARYFADLYRQYGSYEKAAAAYQGGPSAILPDGSIRDYGSDGNLTPKGYAQRFAQNYATIKQSAPKTQGGVGLASMWGGINATISQEYGVVSPDVDQSIYTYGKDYGLTGGHTGIDVGLKRGTQLYMPAGRSGTVVTAGGTKFFRDEDYGDYGTPGRGELRIQMDDGAVLILGHTSAINVRVGQKVSAGTLLGLSGSASGDHLHLEVRVPDKTMPYGYRIVDPRIYFGGR